MLGERIALQLSSPQLGLEIDERAFDLDMQRLIRELDHQISRSRIPRGDGHLHPYPGRPMGLTRDRPGESELPGVAKSDRGHGVELPTKLEPAPGCHLTTRGQGDVDRAAFGATHGLLRASRDPAELALGESCGSSGDPEFGGKPRREDARPTTT